MFSENELNFNNKAVMAKAVDPNAPKPEGAIVSPARGEPIQLPSSLPRSLESALQRYGSANHRLPAATALDASGSRPAASLTYGRYLDFFWFLDF